MAKVLIRSARASFRRAGITATRAGTVVDTDDLTQAQMEALVAEPQISIGPVPEDADGDAEADTKAAGRSGKKAR